MAGSFPNDIPVKIHTLRSKHQTYVSHSHTLKRQARTRSGHVWQFTIETPPLRRSDWQRLMAFGVKQKGRYDAFNIVPKLFATPLGQPGGTPLVNGGSQTGNSVITDGWTINTTVLKAGDFLKFSGHNKVYMATADATSNGSGQVTISIEPALMVSPANDESIIVQNVPFTVAFTSDLREVHVDELGYATFEADVEEVVN